MINIGPTLTKRVILSYSPEIYAHWKLQGPSVSPKQQRVILKRNNEIIPFPIMK